MFKMHNCFYISIAIIVTIMISAICTSCTHIREDEDRIMLTISETIAKNIEEAADGVKKGVEKK